MIEAQISSKFTTWCASLPWRQMARRMACLLLTKSSTRYWFSILGRLIQRCRIAPTYRSRSKGRNIPTSSRGLRELNIYSELLPCTQVIAELSWKPVGVVLSGGPYSVYEADAPHVDLVSSFRTGHSNSRHMLRTAGNSMAFRQECV